MVMTYGHLIHVIKVRQQASNTDFIGYFFEPCLKKYIVSHHTPPRSGFVNQLAIPSSPPPSKKPNAYILDKIMYMKKLHASAW